MDDRSTDSPWTRLDWKLVGLLAVLALGMRVWQLTHTEVAARDSIGFIRHAWQYRQADLADWPQVLRTSEQHPLYPLWILAVSRLVEPFHDGPRPYLMQHSAQLASAIAAVLLVLPLYALGRELFDRRVGFFCALALQCLPVSGRILSDGLSEATFLLLACSALYFGVRALARPSRPLAFALTGLFGGLAYLTRPEGLFVVVATGLMLLIGQFVPLWKRSWRNLAVSSAALSIAGLLTASPIYLATNKLTVKPTGLRVGDDIVEGPRPQPSSGPLLAVWNWPDVKTAADRFWWGFWAVASQVVKGSFYAGWVFILVGLCRHRETSRRHPGAWMLLLVSLGVGYALWRVAVVVGYLSDRHTLLILVAGLPWAVAGMVFLGTKVRLNPIVLPLACVLVGLPKVLEPLHEHRAGFREVGLWLADHTHPVDRITDPLCWSHYYAGRVFLEHTNHAVPAGYQAREFIILEDAGNPHLRVRAYQEAAARVKDREPIQTWEGKRGKKRVRVLVYALPLGA